MVTGNGDDLGVLPSTTPSVAGPLRPEWAETRVAVVVPTYNEVHNPPVLADRLLGLPLPNLRLIVVDDDSPDGTGRVADEIAAGQPTRVNVLHREARDGLGRARIAGMRAAIAGGASYVVQMDGDLSHQPEATPDLLGTALASRSTSRSGTAAGARSAWPSSWRRWRCRGA